MINTITYSLEDAETAHHPDRPAHPVICDDCRDAQHYVPGKRINWRSFHALRTNPYALQVLDYHGAGMHGCACCGSRRWSGRWLVERVRRAE